MLTNSLFRRFSIIIPLVALAVLFFSTTGQAGPYLDSGHGGYNTATKGVARLANYAEGNCAHCHEQHASIDGSEPAPVKPGPSDHLLFTELSNNSLCNYCHDSNQTNGAPNIASQIAKSYSHDPNSLIGSVLCGDCHDSHVAQITTHSEAADGNTVPGSSSGAGVLLSVSGKVVSLWPLPAAPGAGAENLASLTLSDVDPITMEYQLCLKCHGGQVAYPGLENLGRQFNRNNYSVHPVTTSTWKNSYLWGNFGNAFFAPWNAANDSQMYCSDCHGSDNPADPVGPHGSSYRSMLTDTGPGSSYDNLCLRCHNVLNFSNWDSALHGSTIPNRDHNYGPHTGPANSLGCLACHGGIGGGLESNIHGANYKWPDDGGPGTGLTSTTFLVGGMITKNYSVLGIRYCSSTCHTLDGGTGYPY